MQTTYTLIGANGVKLSKEVDLPKTPGYTALDAIIRPLLGGRSLERVNVLHEGQYTDMFVGEDSADGSLPVNPEATAIYRNNVLTHEKGVTADELPAIYGPAVLFSRKVW